MLSSVLLITVNNPRHPLTGLDHCRIGSAMVFLEYFDHGLTVHYLRAT